MSYTSSKKRSLAATCDMDLLSSICAFTFCNSAVNLKLPFQLLNGLALLFELVKTVGYGP